MLVLSEGETRWELAALGKACLLVREKPAYHSDSVQLPKSGLTLAVSLSSALKIQRSTTRLCKDQTSRAKVDNHCFMLGQYTSYFNQKKKKSSLTQRCNNENTENDGIFQTPSK